MSATSIPATVEATRRRNAWWMIGILFVTMLVFAALDLLNLQARNQATGLVYIQLGVLLISAGLMWRKWVTAAVWLVIAGLLGALFVSALFSQGQGLIFSISGLIVVSAIATLTLPVSQRGWALMAAVGVGLTTFLTDTFGPTNRPNTGGNSATLIVVAVLMVVYLAILARQFSN